MSRHKKDQTQLEGRILRKLGHALKTYEMLEEGDRLMVAVSGGKDSFGLLHAMEKIRQRAPFKFELLALTIDQGHEGFDVVAVKQYLEQHEYNYHIETQDTVKVVREMLAPEQTPCPLCARLRRGILVRLANQLKCNKIALGHHQDDIVETVLLNMFYNGALRGMDVKFNVKSHPHISIIRPLCEVPEQWLEEFAREKQFPLQPCGMCGSFVDLKRGRIKKMLGDLELQSPRIKRTFYKALSNIYPGSLPQS